MDPIPVQLVLQANFALQEHQETQEAAQLSGQVVLLVHQVLVQNVMLIIIYQAVNVLHVLKLNIALQVPHLLRHVLLNIQDVKNAMLQGVIIVMQIII